VRNSVPSRVSGLFRKLQLVSAAAFSFSLALQNIVWGLSQPFVGAAADRYGARPVLVVTSLVYAAGLALMVFSKGALGLNVAGFLAGLLFAPASGNATRQRLADEALRAADVARALAEKAESAAEVLGGRVEHYLGRDEEVAWRKVREIREGVQRYTQAQN